MKTNRTATALLLAGIALSSMLSSALSSCSAPSTGARAGDPSPARAIAARLPATFVGTLPCEDCPGVRFTQTLRRDGIYFLRTRYMRPDSASIGRFDEIGRWSFSADSSAIVLTSRQDLAVAIRIVDADHLEVPRPGGTFDGSDDRILERNDAAVFSPHLQLRGIVGRGGFRNCEPPLQLSVAGADGATLTSLLHTPDRPTAFVDIEGTVDQNGDRLTQVRLNGVLTGATCESTAGGATLNDTRWKLIEEHGRQVAVANERTQPTMTIDGVGGMTGMAGCNRMSGSVEIDGGTVRFDQIITTKMACDALSLETAFLRALQETRRWSIDDGILVLLDAEGTIVARLARDTSER